MVPGVDRQPEVERAATTFLDRMTTFPASLTIDGEGGIGKTTVLASIAEDARRRGFLVLATMPAATDSALAYTGLADLLSSVTADTLVKLPEPQRNALDWVLLRSGAPGTPTDQRAVDAAFATILRTMAEQAPVLVVVDDVQWLDQSSAQVVAFAARRITERVGFVSAVRTELARQRMMSLRLARPEDEQRFTVPPLRMPAMHTMIRDRLHLSLSRPALTRIHHISRGNPFFALELARHIGANPDHPDALPSTLAELVADRIGKLDADVQHMLLAAACVANPTVDVVRAASMLVTGACDTALERAEAADIIVIEGNRLRFTHPLLAQGVSGAASAADRRATHRRLADIVTEPEAHARHLALSATGNDPAAVHALDVAAAAARARGAPAAAAELTDLAMQLGGDTPERRIQLATNIFDAGEPARARAILEESLRDLPRGTLRAQVFNLLALVQIFADSFVEACELLQRALAETGVDPGLRVQLLSSLSFAQWNAGLLGPGLSTITEAVAAAEALGDPTLRSQTLGIRATLGFLAGEGIDEDAIRLAVELEGDASTVPLAMRASVLQVILRGWSGQNPSAHRELAMIYQNCLDTGDEIGLFFSGFQTGLVEIWHGEFTSATRRAEELVQRAQQVDRDVPTFIARVLRASAAAYAGREQEARRDIAAAMEAGRRSSSTMLLGEVIGALGFLEVSLGNHEAALSALEPAISRLTDAPDAAEIVMASFLPNLIEAAIAVGRLPVAEAAIEHLETNGRRLDRPWMLAMSGRGRGMLEAARGNLDEAVAHVRVALAEHDRLPMPFERARTQMFYGQLLRRLRLKDAAGVALNEAIQVFDDLGSLLWAARARAELARANLGPHRQTALTPSEERVAALVATGLTNREVSAVLFISPKTVEANLARVYRKLGVRNRAELSQRLAADQPPET